MKFDDGIARKMGIAMIVVHGGMLGKQFLLWGESAQVGGSKHRKARSYTPDAPPPAYPYAVARGTFLAALQHAVPKVTQYLGSKRFPIWLPSHNGLPLASLAEVNGNAAQMELQPWMLSTIPIAPAALVALLNHWANAETLGPDMALGLDMLAWVRALQFAQSLVMRQRVLPSVIEEDANFFTCWVPILRGTDGKLFQDIAQGLPGACRALSHAPEWHALPDAPHRPFLPPMVPAQEVLASFLILTVDALMRHEKAQDAVQIASPYDNLIAFDRIFRTWSPSFQNVHDRWIAALGATDPRIHGARADLPSLTEQVREWQTRQLLTNTIPFRCCLRLEEPYGAEMTPDEAGDLPWRLHFLLQSTEDLSLLIDAEEIWSAETFDPMPQGMSRDVLRMTLLAGLGKLAPHYAPIAECLSAPAPTGIDLDLAHAFAFLTGTAATLQAQGCLVQLPWWWVPSASRRRVKLRAKASSTQQNMGSGLGSRQLITFDWKVALGDAEMSHEELQALARLKAPLVQVRGQWVQVNASEIQSALEFYKKNAHRKATMGDVARLALDDHAHMGDLEVEKVELEGWLADSLGRLRQGQASMEQLPPPARLHAILRPYQLRGYAWLRFLTRWGLGACLADDMGLGKTVVTLALIQRDWDEDGHQPVLVICPTSVVGNWLREAARFTPDLSVLVHHGGTRRKDESFAEEAAQHAIVITSYALLHRDRELLKTVPWRGIVLDEAQNIKNSETKQAQAAATIPGNYRIALTGTPVENSVADLWSLMDFLNPGLLGSATEFKKNFFLPIQMRQDGDATARLKRLTGPFLLRRLKTDPTVISDLPEKLEMNVYCTLTKEQASLYQAVVRDMETRIDAVAGMARRGLIFATLTKLKQVCNHPAHLLGDHSALEGRSGKLARLEAMLEEALAEGDRALIFTQYTEMGGMLQTYLQAKLGCEMLFLHGQTPKPKRDQMVERFQSAGGPPLFLLSLKAGGLGLNLTRANHVFHFDRWWNPAVENQATDRAFRIGQTQAVQVHKFVCVGTLEERIADLIESKQSIAANVVGSGEGWLTELSTAQLRDIFSLRADAVEAF